MKTMKWIMTNLILVFLLVILTNSSVLAKTTVYFENGWALEFTSKFTNVGLLSEIQFEIIDTAGNKVRTIEENTSLAISFSGLQYEKHEGTNKVFEDTSIDIGYTSTDGWVINEGGEFCTITFSSGVGKIEMIPSPSNSLAFKRNIVYSDRIYCTTLIDTDITDEIEAGLVDTSCEIGMESPGVELLNKLDKKGNIIYYLKFNREPIDVDLYPVNQETVTAKVRVNDKYDTYQLSFNKGYRLYPGDKFEVRTLKTKRVLGVVTIPDIKSITCEIDAKEDEDYFEIDLKVTTTLAGAVNIDSMATLNSFSWDRIQILYGKEDGTPIPYEFTSNGRIKAQKQRTEVDYKIQIISDRITGNLGNIIFEKTFKMVSTKEFKATIERQNNEYFVVTEATANEMKEINNGIDFKIGIYTEIYNENSSLKDFKPKGDTNRFSIGTNTSIFAYKMVCVRFYSDKTGLNKWVLCEVPQLAKITEVAMYIPTKEEHENLVASKIINRDKVALFIIDKREAGNGKAITRNEFNNILGFTGKDGNVLEVCYKDERGNVRILDKFEEVTDRVGLQLIYTLTNEDAAIYQQNTLKFKAYNDIMDLNPDTEDLKILMEKLAYYMDLYNYHKLLGKNAPLFIRTKAANDVTVTFELMSNNTTNEHFYRYIGFTPQEYDAWINRINTIIEASVTTIDDGEELVLDPSNVRDVKYIKVRKSGVYYLHNYEVSDAFEMLRIGTPEYLANQTNFLAFAGKSKGTTKDGKKQGVYLRYDYVMDSLTETTHEELANCYPLVEGRIYEIKNTKIPVSFPITFMLIREESEMPLMDIFDERAESTKRKLRNQSDKGYYEVDKGYILRDNFFTSIEEMIAAFIRTLANGLNYTIQFSLRSVSGGAKVQNVDIDTIIFNNYPDTSIAFFEGNTGGDNPSRMINMFKSSVSKWYDIFRGIALTGYIVILLYIGIKILLGVGGQKQAKYKEFISAWLTGLVVLLFFPYVIKYTIEINNIFVKSVEEAKTGALRIEDVDGYIDMSKFSLPTVATKEDYKKIAAQMEVSPYEDGDNSYMAAMARKAHDSEQIADAVVYLIMVWQFMQIVIMYYKRVFIIAFLIAIFPFVALSYVLDKMGDSKAQAFSVWSKELMVNIFIQSMHAIAYVFVLGATYTDGQYSGDWLLSIVGISFMFKFEDILKKIIGQTGQGTVKSLTETAKRTFATVAAVKVATTSIKDNFVGKNSHLGRTISSYKEWQLERKTADMMRNTSKPKPINQGAALPTYDPSVGDADYTNLANDIATIRNRANVSPEELGKALSNVLAHRDNTDPRYQRLMQSLDLSDQQLDELARLQADVTDKITSEEISDPEKYAEFKQKIDQDIEARLAVILPGISEHGGKIFKRAFYYGLRDGDYDMKHKPRESTDEIKVMNEHIDATQRAHKIFDPNRTRTGANPQPFNDTVETVAFGARATRTINRTYSALGVTATTASAGDKKFAKSLAIARDFMFQNGHEDSLGLPPTGRDAEIMQSRAYTSRQTQEALHYLAEHSNDSAQHQSLVQMHLNGIDVEEFKTVVDEKIVEIHAEKHRAEIVPSSRSGVKYEEIRQDLISNEDSQNALYSATRPTTGTEIEKDNIQRNINTAIEVALEDMQEAEDATRDVIRRDTPIIRHIPGFRNEHYTRDCYEESIEDKIGVRDILRFERAEGDFTADTQVEYIMEQRSYRNDQEVIRVEDFAREMLDDTPVVTNEERYEGLTADEHDQVGTNAREKFTESLAKFGATTVGVTLGAPIGAGLYIGMSDEESAVSEAFKGATAGAAIGDNLAERVMGRDSKTKKVTVINPYTKEKQVLELKTEGVTRDIGLLAMIGEDEILSFNDPRLAPFSHNIERQFLEEKRKKEIKQRNTLFSDAVNNSRRRRP